MVTRKQRIEVGREAWERAIERILMTDDDRTVAIVATAYLDAQLEELLRAHLLDVPEARDLLRTDGPLGSFSARISAAYCLGLIGKGEYRSLSLVMRIRNKFAHDPDYASFGDPGIAERCRELRVKALGPQSEDTDLEGWDRFRLTVLGLTTEMDRRLRNMPQNGAREPMNNLPETVSFTLNGVKYELFGEMEG